MAKVKRSVLKEIVKECLLEILFEGIDSESGLYEEEEPIREARQPRQTSRPSPQVKHRRKPQRKDVRTEQVTAAVSELTTDQMMAAIYPDTAMTTLQEQKKYDAKTLGDTCLFVRGVFPNYGKAYGIQKRYYSQIGKSSYEIVSEVLHPELFGKLAYHFDFLGDFIEMSIKSNPSFDQKLQ